MNLFAYGTLMCGDIMEKVSGFSAASVRAILGDYKRISIKGELYPVIVPREGEEVSGVLYTKLPPAAFVRLDAFEGRMYERRCVLVRTEKGAMVRAESYVGRIQFRDLFEDKPWDFDAFMNGRKILFEEGYEGWRSLGGER
jgi:gamma-glutamylcyclotransferase (GGCT)/AIG2-like uncharacterized protein YtfP